jgi:hypothetical protein
MNRAISKQVAATTVVLLAFVTVGACGNDDGSGSSAGGTGAVSSGGSGVDSGSGGSGATGGSSTGGSSTGGSSTGGSSTGGSSTGGSSTGGAGGAAGSCNKLAQAGSAVSATAVSGALPQPLGGVLLDGTYALTKWEVVTDAGLSGLTMQMTEELTSGKGQGYQIVSANGAVVHAQFSFEYSTSGTTLTSSYTCNQTGQDSHGYSVTSTGFEVISSDAVLTFTKK